MDPPARRSHHSSYKFDPSCSSKHDKESNKEASFQYLERAKKCWQCSDKEEAQRLAEKAMKLYPSDEAKELISQISKSQETDQAKEKFRNRDSSTKTDNGTFNFDSSHSSKPEKESNKEVSFKYLERAKKIWQCGDNEEAQRLAEKAMELYPSDEAKELISKISKSKETEKKNQKSIERILKSNDYYEVLDISKEASEMDIKKSYRKLSKQVHPDKNKEPGATMAFQKLQKAYEVLYDKEKRRTYDQTKKFNQGEKKTSAKPDPSTNTNHGSYKFDPNNSNKFHKESNKEASFQHLARAKTFWQSGDNEEALRFAKKAMELYPSDEAKEIISQILKSQENEKEAFKNIERILKTEDYYEILGISKWASDMDMSFQYKLIVKKLNLERNKTPGAAEAFKKVQNAFSVLSDTDKRQKYDHGSFMYEGMLASFHHLSRAKTFWQSGDNEEALRLAEKAMKLYPSDEAKELISKIIKSQETEKENLNSLQRILKSSDYYVILGVAKEASGTLLLLSHSKLEHQFHPDRNKAPEAAEAYKKIQNAFSVL